MAYIVDPTNPNSPTNTQGATQGAEELRALKAYIAGLAVPAAASAGPRQCIVDAVKDASGYNNALSAGAGLRVSLAATALALQMTFANGFSNGRAINSEEQIAVNNADILGVDLPLSNTSFLYRDYGVGYGSTLIPPQYGYAFDRTKGALLNFEGANGAVATTDDFGNTWVLTTATITTAQFKFGASSLNCTGGAARSASSVNFTTMGDGSWEISLWFRINALPGVGVNATLWTANNAAQFGAHLYLNNNAATVKVGLDISSNGTSKNIANTVLGANTVWALNQWNKVRLVFDALAGTYRVYLSLNGAAETQEISVASTAKVCAITTFALGYNFTGGNNQFDGWIDAFRFLSAATKTTTENPAAVAPTISDYSINWFDIPSMKMWEVTGASVAAATNPVLTARSRLFLGEADTSGAAVTAIRNYALKGEYRSDISTSFGPGASVTKSHNLGIKPREARLILTNLTEELGFTPGDEVEVQSAMRDNVGAGYYGGPNIRRTRNTVQFWSPNSITFAIQNGGTYTGITAANWGYRVEVQRSW